MKINSVIVRWRLGLLLGVGTLLLSAPIVDADPLPPLPAKFDRETVTRLLNSIDQDRNALVLRAGYFARRGTKDLPGAEGLALLREQVEKEPPGTLRWALLKALQGYGAMRLNRPEGMVAYGEFFDEAIKHRKIVGQDAPSAVEKIWNSLVRHSVSELVSVLTVNSMGPTPRDGANELLGKAFLVWSWLPEPSPGETSPEGFLFPVWYHATEFFGNEVLFPQIEGLLKAVPEANRCKVLLAAANITQQTPDLAMTYLNRAQPLIFGLDSDKPSPWVETYDRLYLGILVQSGKWDEVVDIQQRMVKRTGQGHGTLLQYLWRAGDRKGIKEVVGQLSATDANEYELNFAAALLLEWGRKPFDDELRQLGKKLLLNYLTLPRARSEEEEINARVKLGEAFLHSRDEDEIRPFVMVDLKGFKAQNRVERLQRLQNEWQKFAEQRAAAAQKEAGE